MLFATRRFIIYHLNQKIINHKGEFLGIFSEIDILGSKRCQIFFIVKFFYFRGKFYIPQKSSGYDEYLSYSKSQEFSR